MDQEPASRNVASSLNAAPTHPYQSRIDQIHSLLNKIEAHIRPFLIDEPGKPESTASPKTNAATQVERDLDSIVDHLEFIRRRL